MPDRASREVFDVAGIGHDPELFESFYRAHVDMILRFVTRRVQDPYRAADLTAEVFLAAIGSAPSYRPGRGSPTAWLYGVAHRTVAAERRQSARESQALQRVAGRRLVCEDEVARIDERIDAENTRRRLYAAMERLSDRERDVLELVAIDELTVAEAAQALGIRPVTARVRLHRARQQMRADLSPQTPLHQPLLDGEQQ